MKDAISYYYNLNIDVLSECDGFSYFIYKGFKYYYLLFDRSEEELVYLVNITNKMYEKNKDIYTFIVANNGKFYSEFSNKKYVLLRINSISFLDCITISDILLFNSSFADSKVLISPWTDNWKHKVDEFEELMNDIGDDYPLIQESCDYYIGLAENAISYFNDCYEMNSHPTLVVSHHSLKVDEFYNPLNFMMDYETRDLSMYVYDKFYMYCDIYDELEGLFKKRYRINS